MDETEKGAKNFFQKKKLGGKDFFSTKKRGAKTLFQQEIWNKNLPLFNKKFDKKSEKTPLCNKNLNQKSVKYSPLCFQKFPSREPNEVKRKMLSESQRNPAVVAEDAMSTYKYIRYTLTISTKKNRP